MAMTPAERLAQLSADEQQRIYRYMLEAQNDLLTRTQQAINSGATGTAAHLRRSQDEIGRLLQSMDNGVATWAQEATRNVYEATMTATDDAVGKAIGATITGGIGFDAPIHLEAIQALADAAYTPFGSYIGNIGRRVDDVFRAVQLDQARAALSGATTAKGMARSLRQNLEASNIFDFTDKAGRSWSLNRYTDMVSRTVIRECETQGTANRLVQNGITLGEVSGHITKGGPCDMCSPWEGRILDLDGSSKGKYPTMAEAKAGGLWHPNCKHNLLPHVESVEDAIKRMRQELGDDAVDVPKSPKAAGVKDPPKKPKKAGLDRDRKQIDGFKSPKEAQAWAQKRFPSTDVDFKKMDLQSAQATCRAMSQFDDTFPSLIDHGLDFFGTYADRAEGGAAYRITQMFRKKKWFSGEYAHVYRFLYGNPSQTLGLNPRFFSKIDDFLASLKRCQIVKEVRKMGPDGWTTFMASFHPAGCDTVESVVLHELGHFLDNYIGMRTNFSPIAEWRRGATGVLSTMTGRGQQVPKILELSEYALNGGSAERFAEAFSQAMAVDGDDISDLAKEVRDMIPELQNKVQVVMRDNQPHKPSAGIGLLRGQ